MAVSGSAVAAAVVGAVVSSKLAPKPKAPQLAPQPEAIDPNAGAKRAKDTARLERDQVRAGRLESRVSQSQRFGDVGGTTNIKRPKASVLG